MTFKTYLRNRINSKRFRLNGLVPSAQLPWKQQLRQAFCDHMLYRLDQLPPKVDLRSAMTPVENQSKIGSCAANSFAGAYEYLTKKANGRDTDVSRLFIYYNARVKDQKTQNVVDSGCTMTSAIEALEEFGTCLESLWPYDISQVNTRPKNEAYEEAKSHKITEALRLNIDLHEMKSCLAQGFPFAFGLKLYASFDQASTTGVVPMPNALDGSRQSHGNHALLAVGYSDQSKAFIVRNSWGEHWGDKGYCYIPYDYLANPTHCFDVWTVRKLATDNFGREHWDSQDRVNYMSMSVNDVFSGNVSGYNGFIEHVEEDDGSSYSSDSSDSSDSDDRYYEKKRNRSQHQYNDFNNGWNQYQGFYDWRNNIYDSYQGSSDAPVHGQQFNYPSFQRIQRQDYSLNYDGGYPANGQQMTNNFNGSFQNQFNPLPTPTFNPPYPTYGGNYGYF